MFLQTLQDTFEDDAKDSNEHVKGAMEKVLLLIMDTIPNILDETATTYLTMQKDDLYLSTNHEHVSSKNII